MLSLALISSLLNEIKTVDCDVLQQLWSFELREPLLTNENATCQSELFFHVTSISTLLARR